MKGVFWILAAAAGASGCWQPTTVPPATAIPAFPPPAQVTPNITPLPQPPLSAPALVPLQPDPPPAIEPSPISGNPWRPTVKARGWKSIVLHHTAATSGSVESIHETHLQRKDGSGNSWLGIGYHFVVGNGNGMDDGEIEPTFRWKQQMHGAHAGEKEHNQTGIGIALIGNFEETPPTPKQLASIKRLVSVLKGEYGIPNEKVIGHQDVKATECPGKLFPLEDVRRVPAVSFRGLPGVRPF